MGFDVDALEKEVDAKVDQYKQEITDGSTKDEETPGVRFAAPQEAPPPVEEKPKAAPEDDVSERLKMLERELKALSNENRHLKIEVTRQSEAVRHPLPQVQEIKEAGLSPEERELLEEEGFSDNVLNALAKRLTPYPSGPTKDEETAERLARIEQDVAETRQTKFEAGLTEAVPDWEAVNTSPRFINWLKDNKPEFVNATYEQVINHLGSTGDVAGVAKIFNRFKESTGQSTTQDRTTQDRTTERSLEQEVSPRSSGTAQSAAPPVSWDGQKVKRFYQEWADGKMTDEEARKIESQIYKSVRV